MELTSSFQQRVVAEIVASEKTYLAGLSELVDLYITPASQPLRNSSNHTVRETVVPQAERALVFSVVESIAHFHKEVFLPELEAAAAQVIPPFSPALEDKVVTQAAVNVAGVFTRHAAYLKSAFCLSRIGCLSLTVDAILQALPLLHSQLPDDS